MSTGRTDHGEKVAALRQRSETLAQWPRTYASSVDYALAADLLELHDATALSLDSWPVALEFISLHLRWVGTGIGIDPNGA